MPAGRPSFRISSRQLLAVGLTLAGWGVAGCSMSASVVKPVGSVQLVMPADREVQFVSSDIQSINVTITDQISGQSYVQAINPPTLLAQTGGSSYNFTAANLPDSSYVAKVDAYLDTAETQLAGEAVSRPFNVSNNGMTTVQMPSLSLLPTPIGDWAITVQTTLSKGYSISSCQSSLTQTNGLVVSGPSGGNPGTTSKFTWGNVVGAPTGASTTSVTFSAVEGSKTITKTQIATISIVPGATVSSTIAFSFP